MLKSTEPKVIVESSLDKLWGTEVQLRDQNALNPEKWHGTGWMSEVLHVCCSIISHQIFNIYKLLT